VDRDTITVWTLGADAQHLTTHDRARVKGSWVVNGEHWDGLPGHTQPHAGPTTTPPSDASSADDQPPPSWTAVEVVHRPLADYDQICHDRAGGGV